MSVLTCKSEFECPPECSQRPRSPAPVRVKPWVKYERARMHAGTRRSQRHFLVPPIFLLIFLVQLQTKSTMRKKEK